METKKLLFILIMAGMALTNGLAQEVQWKKNFGGTGKDGYYSAAAISDGIVAVGCSRDWSFGNGDWVDVEGKGNYDAIIVKYDNAGNVVWKKNFGGSSFDYFYSATTVSGGFVAVGDSHAFGNGDWAGVTGRGNGDAVIVKFDEAGNVVWKKNFGGSDDDRYDGVTTVSDGIIAVGHAEYGSHGNGDLAGLTGQNNDDAIIVKYDFNGNLIWKKSYATNYRDWFESATAVPDGIIAVGHQYTYIGDNYDGSLIVKYDNSGNVIWEKTSTEHNYYAVAAVPDGVVVGADASGGSKRGVIKYDNAGNIVWKKNTEDNYHSITVVSDGMIMAGEAYVVSSDEWIGYTGRGAWDAILVKYDFGGNVVWRKHFGGKGYDEFGAVVAVSDGFVAVGESYIAYGSTDSSFGNGDMVDMVGRGGGDAIVVKYSTGGVNIDEPELSNISLYPNPATEQINIQGLHPGEAIHLYNINGQLLLSREAKNGKETIIVAHLPAGIYLLKTDTGRAMKWIKQ